MLDARRRAADDSLADLPARACCRSAGSPRRSIDRTIAAFDEALPDSEFKADLLDESARPIGRARDVRRVRPAPRSTLGPHGLVVYDSSDPAAKPLARPVFVRELAHPGETARWRPRRDRRWSPPAITRRSRRSEGAVSLFYLNDGRESDRVLGDRPRSATARRRSRRSWRKSNAHPEHFSPNVLLRPIVQDTLFPTICYVAGPERAGLPRPAARRLRALRRADAADVSARHRHDRRLGHAAVPRQVRRCRSRRSSRGTNRRSTSCCRTSCRRRSSRRSQASAVVEARMAKVAAAVPQIDPTLEGTVQSTLRGCSTICGRSRTR